MTDQITVLDPPPFVEKFDYKPLKQMNDPVTRKRVYLTPDGEKLPSVTTILGATKDMTHLNLWKKRVGEAKAQQIVTEAAGVGTAMHANLERFIVGIQRQPGNNPVHVQANKMADVIIENGLNYATNVYVTVKSTANRVNIFIDDDGPGIPINHYKNVFKPFYRLDSSRNLNQVGVGLGMSISEDIIRSHGGNIELNESKHKGLQVRISLPF